MQKKYSLYCLFISIAGLILSFICSFAEAYNLPDSGQTQCFSNKGKIKIAPCPPPGELNAQDGSYTINPLSYRINSDGTVLDLNTNLMWQREDDGIMRTWPEAEIFCSEMNLGGYADWRLPSKRELIGILSYGLMSPAIDRSAFLNTKNAGYWTSSKMPCLKGDPWSVDFASGYTNLLAPSARTFTRCVRGGPLPLSRFTNNGNGTVSDLSTGLTWQQNEKSSVGWTDALSYCESLSSGGYTDWRMPNIKEYESLTLGVAGTSIMTDYLNFNINFPSWSSTTYLPISDYSYKWTMNHHGIFGICSVKDRNCNKYGVRCVRGKSSPPVDEEEIRVSPSEIDLWYANGNGVTLQEVFISNTGRGHLTIGTIAIPSHPFSIASDTCSGTTITALKSCSFTILFDPDVIGTVTDHIAIASSDADNPVVDIDLKGAAMSSFYLSDTGQASCYNGNGTLIICPPQGSTLAQDGSYSMNQPFFLHFADGIVKENNSLLVWQQQDDGLTRTWDEAALYCEDLTLGGYADWRLPALRELSGIADYSRYNPAIDLSVFPATKKSSYWSSSFSETYKDNAWFMNFSDGTAGNSIKASRYYVRCVRAGRLPSGTLIDNNDGTITDSLTGLMWEQGDATASNWESSLAYCQNRALGGYPDWRLPNIRELTSIIDIRYKPAIDHTFFPQVACGDWSKYWTSTSYLALLDSSTPYVPDDAYVVDFFNASTAGAFEHKFYSNYNVRCVRGGTVKLPATMTGAVTDSSTGLPLPDTHINITDSAGAHITSTDSNGIYSVNNLTSGSFAASFEKGGYTKQIVSGTVTDGQTVILDVRLTRIPPPAISITSPVDGTVVTTSSIEVNGLVSSDATVTVNGIEALVDEGFFSASVNLQKGNNTITACATDPYGQTTSYSITISLITQGSINGMVTESLSVSPLQAATVLVTDSLNRIHTTQTDQDGRFLISGIEEGSFSTTITKEGFKPYTVAGTLASGETKTINAELTRIFSAVTLGNYGNVTVMEVTGNYDAKTPDGSVNTFPRQEIAKEFFRLHPDEYDFLIVLSNFDYAMPDPAAKGFYLEVKNDTQGIGKPVFDNTAFFGSYGNLQGIIDMGNVVTLITDPRDSNFEDTVNTLIHEQMHRWGAYVKYRDTYGTMKTGLLGKDDSHWSFLLDSGASLHYGNAWRDNGNGTFTSTGGGKYCSPLDLYLMGFIDKSEVPPMLLIENPVIDSSGLPSPGATVSGSPQYVTIDEIIAAEGERMPDASSSQKVFKAGFILITAPGLFTGNELQGIETLQNAWAGRFSSLTGGKGAISDVAQSLTVLIISPVQGDITSDHVTVKGAFINSMGFDTGVTVNGIPATVYGNQFIVNDVPLADGLNTISAIATDSAGNTAADSVAVNSTPDEQYIRLQPNTDAGIAPLDLILSILSSFSFDDAEITVTGPSQPEFLSSGENDYRFAVTVEGIYTFSAHVSGQNGIALEDSITVTVTNQTQMDTLMQRKWDGMKNALANRDVDTAVTLFTVETKTHYHDIFTSLDAQMPQIVEDMQDIERIYIGGNSAKYRIVKDEVHEGQVVPITHYIYFAVDHDGLWKIDWY